MRATRTASAALLVTAAVALSAPAASAGDGIDTGLDTGIGIDTGVGLDTDTDTGLGLGLDTGITSFGFSVTPRTVAPGGTVTLTSDGCEAPSVTVTSGIFDTVTLAEGRPGRATVDLDAQTGAEYEIAFDCKGERGTTTLTVAHGTTPPPPPAPVTPVKPMPPHKGVKAGFGSSTGSDALGVAELATGAVLIAAATGAAIALTRRRRRGGRP
ncbi:hypothetical protein ACFQ8C_14965 [Streptomyces sp. NPDC056503]|uniref:hypothetical protein n=1 Tax=Streptomyces sp. NPDC056503 TaxID=3345842 RepID=UPI0036BBEA7C